MGVCQVFLGILIDDLVKCFLGSVETQVSSSGWETTTATGGERPNFERV